jgi:nitrite reductase/ring-hydroxylating ferredoxin subunit
MGFLASLLGICQTKPPRDRGCWTYANGRLEIEWARAQELQKPCGAIRLEGNGLPERILVIYGIDGQFHAFRNRCPFSGRRFDPIPGTDTLRSCSVPELAFAYSGEIITGPIGVRLRTYEVVANRCRLVVLLD